MTNTLIQKIIANKIPCYFISPHLDDAVLSAGGLIAYLSRYTRVEVVTVFTTASLPPYTFSAKRFLQLCSYKDANTLFNDRRHEDRNALSLIGVKPRHLGKIDALWRKIPSPNFARRILSRMLSEFLHIYPTYRMHVIRGNISSHDKPLLVTLGEELRNLIDISKDYMLFCPLAVRSHIDHTIVRDVCLANFTNVIMWEDFPYNMRSSLDRKEVNALGVEVFRWGSEKELKKNMFEMYTSQRRAMFQDGNIPSAPEVYYSAQKDMFKK